MRIETSPSVVPAREPRSFLLGVTILLILAGVLRFHALGFPAFDCDELYALRIQGGSLKEIASLMGRSAFHDFHPPLGYLVYMFWIQLFGTSEVAVRSLPLLLGLTSVALIGFVGRRIGGGWVGLAAAAFLASNPLHIAYSQEARPYALAVTLTIAAHLFFLRSLGEPSARNQIGYAVLIVAAIYTHYFALLALLPHGLIALWLLLKGEEGSRRAARQTLLVFGCAMATYIAWLPALLFQTSAGPEGMALDVPDLDVPPLSRVGFLMKETVGMGVPPILPLAIAALLVLLVSAFLWRKRLSFGSTEPGSGGAPPRKLGVFLLLAAVFFGAALWVAAPLHFFPVAREVLLSEGYGPDAVERELRGLQQFTVSIPLAMGVIGLLMLGWRRLSSLLDRLSRMSSGGGRPLAANALLAFLLFPPVVITVVLAFRYLSMLSERNLLIFEPVLALTLAAGAVGLAKPRWGRLVLVLAVVCLALGRFHYQPVSGIFGVPGKRLGVHTGAWRDLVRELNRRGGRELPLVMVDVPLSDPAEFYLRDRPVKRLPEDGRVARASLPAEFRFVHLKGHRGSARLLSSLSGVAPLERRFQVDEYVIYDTGRRFR